MFNDSTYLNLNTITICEAYKKSLYPSRILIKVISAFSATFVIQKLFSRMYF